METRQTELTRQAAQRHLERRIARAEEIVAEAKRRAAHKDNSLQSMLAWGEFEEAAVAERNARELKGWLSLFTAHPRQPSEAPLTTAQLHSIFTQDAQYQTARVLNLAAAGQAAPVELRSTAQVAQTLNRIVDELASDPTNEPKED